MDSSSVLALYEFADCDHALLETPEAKQFFGRCLPRVGLAYAHASLLRVSD